MIDVQSNKIGKKRYELTNHLGNVLATFTDRKVYNSIDGYYEPVITMKADYYAFGMLMPNRFEGVDDTRHLFNGMEHDMEVSREGNSYTTQFRQYDPRLGRWKSLDPLMASFPWQSPYVAFDNNPIFYTDPLGLAAKGGDGEPVQKGDTFTGDDGKKYTLTHSEVEVYAPAELLIEFTIEQHYEEPSAWQIFWHALGNGIRNFETSLVGNSYWTFGVELKSSDGERVGERSWLPKVRPEHFDNVLVIENFDELMEIVGLMDKANATFEMAKAKNDSPVLTSTMTFNKYQKFTAGKFKGEGNRAMASKQWKAFNEQVIRTNDERIRAYNETMKNHIETFAKNLLRDEISNQIRPKVVKSGMVRLRFNIVVEDVHGNPVESYFLADDEIFSSADALLNAHPEAQPDESGYSYTLNVKKIK